MSSCILGRLRPGTLSCVSQIQTPQLAKQLAMKRHLFLEPVALPILVAGGVLLSTGQQLLWLDRCTWLVLPASVTVSTVNWPRPQARSCRGLSHALLARHEERMPGFSLMTVCYHKYAIQ